MTSESNKKFSFNIEDQQVPESINIPNYPKLETMPDERVGKIKNLLALLKWLLIPLSIMQLLFILPEAYPLLVTMLFPLMGLIGAKSYSFYWTTLFGISLILLVLVQIITMGILKGVAYIVLQCIVIVFELFSAFISLRASKFIWSLSSQDMLNLKSG